MRMKKEFLNCQIGAMFTTMTNYTQTTSESHSKREKRASMLPCVLNTTECMRMLKRGMPWKALMRRKEMMTSTRKKMKRKMVRTKKGIDESF